jgi:hypothetical protein
MLSKLGVRTGDLGGRFEIWMALACATLMWSKSSVSVDGLVGLGKRLEGLKFLDRAMVMSFSKV